MTDVLLTVPVSPGKEGGCFFREPGEKLTPAEVGTKASGVLSGPSYCTVKFLLAPRRGDLNVDVS